jgi:hypothetical protein
MLKTLLPESKPEQDIFLLSISSLKNIEQQNEFVATIDFILKFLEFSGFGVELPQVDYVNFDKLTADFTTQKTQTTIQIDKQVYLTLKNIYERVEVQENEKTLKQVLRLLHNVIYLRFNEEIKSFEFI